MLKVENLGFENLDELDFIAAPKCECGDCAGECYIVVKKGEDIGDVMASLLGVQDCPSVGGLVLGSDGIHKMFYPTHLIKGGEYEPGVFGCLIADTNKSGSREEVIGAFVDIVNDFGLHHLAILEESHEKKGNYMLVSN